MELWLLKWTVRPGSQVVGMKEAWVTTDFWSHGASLGLSSPIRASFKPLLFAAEPDSNGNY